MAGRTLKNKDAQLLPLVLIVVLLLAAHCGTNLVTI